MKLLGQILWSVLRVNRKSAGLTATLCARRSSSSKDENTTTAHPQRNATLLSTGENTPAANFIPFRIGLKPRFCWFFSHPELMKLQSPIRCLLLKTGWSQRWIIAAATGSTSQQVSEEADTRQAFPAIAQGMQVQSS